MGIFNVSEDEPQVHVEKPKVRIEKEATFWLNKTKSGKGVIIVIEDQAFISSLTNIKEFVEGKRKGVAFNLLHSSKD